MIEDISWGRELGLGVLVGIVFIILNSAFGFVIGIPQLAFSSEAERFVIVSGVAPLGEELVFRALLPFVLMNIGLGFYAILAINAIVFPLYHYFAYGSSISAASSLFIGAGIFAVMAFLITYYNSNADEFQVPIASIIAHSIINTWLSVRAFGLVVTGV